MGNYTAAVTYEPGLSKDAMRWSETQELERQVDDLLERVRSFVERINTMWVVDLGPDEFDAAPGDAYHFDPHDTRFRP